MTPSGENACVQETRQSFRGRYGILALPMALMFALGLFGLRPGQMMKLGYITNFTLILNFLLILCIGTGFLFTTDFQSKISNKFLMLFHIFLSMELATLCYICYKKYNLFSLLQDIRKVRSQCLSKGELFFICVIFIAIITSIGGIFYFSMVIVHNIFKTGNSQQWKVSIIPIDNYTAVKILALIELIVISISWSSVLITVLWFYGCCHSNCCQERI